MAGIRIKRQAITPRGMYRRVDDAGFRQVPEPRAKGRITFPLLAVLGLCVLACASNAVSLRALERRSEQLRKSVREKLGLPDERVADNTVGGLLCRVEPMEMRRALHREVKAEYRRGNLEPTRLSSGLSVAAIDGKVLSTLRWRDLVSSTRNELAKAGDERTKDKDWRPSEDDVRTVFATRFPHVQLVKPDDGQMYGLVRLHRTTLVSSEAAVCIDQRPIPGATNEVGAICDAAGELLQTYKRTSLIDLVTTDAGNTSLALASLLHEQGVGYFLAIKQPQGEIYAEAVRVLGDAVGRTADASFSEERSGQTVSYQVWQHELPGGFLGWTHARQVIRVERVVADDNGVVSVGNRYFVCSLNCEELPARDALTLCRMHWRCENEGHWTSDAILLEDARRAVGSRHPIGILVMAFIRMIAQNILAVLRALSRIGPSKLKPSWKDVVEHALVAVFEPVLDSTEFDAVEA